MKLFSLSLLIFYLLSNLGPTYLLALPDGTKTLAGDVSLSQTAKEIRITASDGAILEHAAFDIAVDETVRFIQPSSSSRVLNRISAAAPSVIDGKLIANGHVYLVNPAGVLFGENSVVEVGKLHAVAGSLTDQDFINSVDNFTALSGEVRNAGSITAGEVVLAGSSLTNSGRISAPNGLVLLAVGGGLELSSPDGSLSVTLNEENPLGAAFAVGDLAGQALLQSGIIQASRVEIRGSAITHSGTVSASVAKLANFSTFSGSSGSFAVENLSVSGGGDSGDASTLDLSSKANSISGLELAGVFENFTLRSDSSLVLGPSAADSQAILQDSFKAQSLDLRVDEGGLALRVSFSPHTADLDNSLLLAASKNLTFSYPLGQYGYLRRIFYGQRLALESTPGVAYLPDTVSMLDATSLGIGDLSPRMNSQMLRSLIKDNPDFHGFLPVEVSSPEPEGTDQSASEVPSIPNGIIIDAPPLSEPDFPPSLIPDQLPSPQLSPGFLDLNLLTDTQLDLLFKHGFLSHYSFYLKPPSLSVVFSEVLAESGGASAVFGGDFAIVATAAGPVGTTVATSLSSSVGVSADAGSVSADAGGASADAGGASADAGSASADAGDDSADAGDDSADAGDDSADAGDDSADAGEGEGSSAAAVAAKVEEAVPFDPITTPILSPEANLILDAALSDAVEASLQNYLQP